MFVSFGFFRSNSFTALVSRDIGLASMDFVSFSKELDLLHPLRIEVVVKAMQNAVTCVQDLFTKPDCTFAFISRKAVNR